VELGWSWNHRGPTNWADADTQADAKFIGFTYGRDKYGFQVTVPLWFPAFVLVLLTWFIWRKTRVKGSGNAFPVEAANKGEDDLDG